MVTKHELKKAAELAQLAFTEKEYDALEKELQPLLSLMDSIRQSQPSGSFVLTETTPLRQDEPKPPFPREDILRNSPLQKDGFFVLSQQEELP